MDKPPLYRKENTTAHACRRLKDGGEFRDARNTRRERESEATRRAMHGKTRRGRDYTPLFRFLLSRVGRPWAEVHAEAVARLDQAAPIFWLVALSEDEGQDYVRTGESSFFSGLYVDDGGVLRVVAPEIGPSTLEPSCACCTHTFNGVRFTKAYRGG